MAPAARQKTSAAIASEADIATNTALLQYAEASRLAKSWLSGFTSTSTPTNGHSDQEADEKEDEDNGKDLFKNKDLYSETGGIGYHAPESAASTSRPAATDPTTTFLRKRLLGGRTGAQASLRGDNIQRHNATAARPRPHQARQHTKGAEDSDEEESRATVGKRRGKSHGNVSETTALAEQAQPEDLNEDTAADLPARQEPQTRLTDSTEPPHQSSAAATQPKANKKRGTGSYLDELLASRAAKRQKKNEKKRNPG